MARRATDVAVAQERRYTVAFANLTEEPGVTVEGTGFTGRDVREGFALAARRHPIDLVFYDNQRDNARALANAEDAIAKKVDLYVLYHRDPATNAAIVDKLKRAGIPVIALNHAAGGTPLYTIDNVAAGRIAGEALGDFAARNWRAQNKIIAVLGPLGAQAEGIPERVHGVTEGLKRQLPSTRVVMLDTQGNPAQVGALLGKLVSAQPTAKILVATTDDQTALAAKAALESAGRLQDGAIVSHGVDRSSTAASTRRRRSTRTTGAASSSGRSPSIGPRRLQRAAPGAGDAAGPGAASAHDGRPSARHGGQRLHRVPALRHELRPSDRISGTASRGRSPRHPAPSPSGLPRRSGFHSDSR